MPLSDSSQTYIRAVWPKPSPAVLRLTFYRRRLRGLPVLVHEVSRRVWGLRLRRTEQELALSPLFMLPSAHYKDVGVRFASFRSSITHPTYSPVYASLCTSRYLAQNSGPSGSLLLTRETFASSASCRFIPAHCNGDFATTIAEKSPLLRFP
jgi:hypothetical protein